MERAHPEETGTHAQRRITVKAIWRSTPTGLWLLAWRP